MSLHYPADLMARPSWVVWKLETREGQTKPTKIPYSPKGYKASTVKPDSWGTYDEARESYNRGGYSGLGFVFSDADPYAFLDFDNVISNGQYSPEMLEAFANVPSWAEYSQSGTGVHIICQAEGQSLTTMGYELYHAKRFVALTGHHVPETPKVIQPCQEGRDWYHQKITDLKVLRQEKIRGDIVAPVDRITEAVLRSDLGAKDKGSGKYELDICPLSHEHGDAHDLQGAVYFAAGFNGYTTPQCTCLHTHDISFYDLDDYLKKSDGTYFAESSAPTGFSVLPGWQSSIPQGPIAVAPPKLFSDRNPIGLHSLNVCKDPPEEIITGMLQRGPFGIIGTGGVAKTTLTLKVMVHIVLGIPLWGNSIPIPGPCLFISSEDDMDTMLYRLFKICEAMSLTREQLTIVSNNLYIHDVSGELARFVEADRSGNLTITHHVDDIIELYRGVGLRMSCMDPAAFFGPGERFVNDGEAALMKVASRMSRELGGAAGYIHHTSKEVAKNKDTSAHAGRGGAAFADNSRTAWVLHTYDPAHANGLTLPSSVPSLAIDEGQVSYLTVAKLSGHKRPVQPFWLIRDHFTFTLERTPDSETVERDRVEQTASLKLKLMTQVHEKLKECEREGMYLSKRQARSELEVFVDGVKQGERKITTIIEHGMEIGVFVLADLPEAEVRGTRTQFIKASMVPVIKSGYLQGEKELAFKVLDTPPDFT